MPVRSKQIALIGSGLIGALVAGLICVLLGDPPRFLHLSAERGGGGAESGDSSPLAPSGEDELQPTLPDGRSPANGAADYQATLVLPAGEPLPFTKVEIDAGGEEVRALSTALGLIEFRAPCASVVSVASRGFQSVETTLPGAGTHIGTLTLEPLGSRVIVAVVGIPHSLNGEVVNVVAMRASAEGGGLDRADARVEEGTACAHLSPGSGVPFRLLVRSSGLSYVDGAEFLPRPREVIFARVDLSGGCSFDGSVVNLPAGVAEGRRVTLQKQYADSVVGVSSNAGPAYAPLDSEHRFRFHGIDPRAQCIDLSLTIDGVEVALVPVGATGYLKPCVSTDETRTAEPIIALCLLDNEGEPRSDLTFSVAYRGRFSLPDLREYALVPLGAMSDDEPVSIVVEGVGKLRRRLSEGVEVRPGVWGFSLPDDEVGGLLVRAGARGECLPCIELKWKGEAGSDIRQPRVTWRGGDAIVAGLTPGDYSLFWRVGDAVRLGEENVRVVGGRTSEIAAEAPRCASMAGRVGNWASLASFPDVSISIEGQLARVDEGSFVADVLLPLAPTADLLLGTNRRVKDGFVLALDAQRDEVHATFVESSGVAMRQLRVAPVGQAQSARFVAYYNDEARHPPVVGGLRPFFSIARAEGTEPLEFVVLGGERLSAVIWEYQGREHALRGWIDADTFATSDTLQLPGRYIDVELHLDATTSGAVELALASEPLGGWQPPLAVVGQFVPHAMVRLWAPDSARTLAVLDNGEVVAEAPVHSEEPVVLTSSPAGR